MKIITAIAAAWLLWVAFAFFMAARADAADDLCDVKYRPAPSLTAPNDYRFNWRGGARDGGRA